MTNLSLRQRIFLFFALIGLGGALLILGALYLGYQRSLSAGIEAGFLMAAIVGCFGLLALATGVWLLFDENVAKPIERMAATLRSRAHAGVSAKVDEHAARYLGDLAPAAAAISDQLSDNALDAAAAVASETERLAAEKARLTALLTDIPVAMVLINPSHQIVLYDGQAAEALAQIAPPRLNAPIFDYLNQAPVLAAHAQLIEAGKEVAFQATSARGQYTFDARLKPMGAAKGYMLILDDVQAEFAPDASRPVVYDFDLLDAPAPKAIEDTPLRDLTYTVFDSETTGFLPHKDDVVQIGAVRVVNGKMVAGEVVDQLVNPGRPIPPNTTKVHGISDDMVQGAPDPVTACRDFHDFARGSVLVAHNAPFDVAFMRRYGKRAGVEWDHPVLDTVLLSAVLFGASETHTLDALCDRLGITIPPELRHTALGDADATAKVLCKLLPMLESRGFTTFGQVIEQTRKHGRLLEDLN